MIDSPPGFQPLPSMVFPLDVWHQMMGYIEACPVEVNGFGYVTRLDDGNLHVDQVFILEQTATAGSVEVEALALARHMTEMAQQGLNGGIMRLQWHSHVDMEAYFSPTDLFNIESYAQTDWALSIVANKRGEYQARLDVFRPFRVWTPVSVLIARPNDDVREYCRREIADKVKIKGRYRARQVTPNNGVPTAQLLPASSITTVEG